MKEIKPIMTVEEIYNRKGRETGEIIIDATVCAITHTTTREAESIALLTGTERKKLTVALELLVGVPLKEMIDEWRMLQARDLCLAQDLELDEVARQCGFGSYKGFVQAFIRRWDTTPYSIRTGHVIRNGNYKINRSANQRTKAIDNANAMRQQQEAASDGQTGQEKA